MTTSICVHKTTTIGWAELGKLLFTIGALVALVLTINTWKSDGYLPELGWRVGTFGFIALAGLFNAGMTLAEISGIRTGKRLNGFLFMTELVFILLPVVTCVLIFFTAIVCLGFSITEWNDYPSFWVGVKIAISAIIIIIGMFWAATIGD